MVITGNDYADKIIQGRMFGFVCLGCLACGYLEEGWVWDLIIPVCLVCGKGDPILGRLLRGKIF